MEDPSDIRNWQRRPDGVTTSGKLEHGDPARLASMGVKCVVNLALDNHPEALENEALLVRQAGMRYIHIPVPFEAPDRGHVAVLAEALEAEDGPIHVHCIMNYRVTAFFYLLDRASGVDEEEARLRMAEIWDPLASDDPRATPWKALLSS